MKQSGFKKITEYFTIRLSILKTSIIYAFQLDTAFLFNNWANIISTLAYTIAQLIFLNVVFFNVDLIAGYSKDEMILFLLLGQIWAYTYMGIFMINNNDLIASINSGQLDLLLTKPFPALFFLQYRKVNLLKIIRDGVPPLLVILLSINWNNLDIIFSDLIAGIIVLALGIAASISLNFYATLPAFWLGESSSLNTIMITLEDDAGHKFPLQGWSRNMQLFFTTILPIGLSTGAATSVVLNKLPAIEMILLSGLVAFISIILQRKLWNIALRHYSSASS